MRFSILSIFFFAAFAAFAQPHSKSQPFNPKALQVKWELLDNSLEGKRQALLRLTLMNTGHQDLPAQGWRLYFNGSPAITLLEGSAPLLLKHINGDLLQLSPAGSFKGIQAGQQLELKVRSRVPIENTSRHPLGFYFVWDAEPATGYPIGSAAYVRPDSVKFPALWVSSEAIFHQNEFVQDIPGAQLPPIFPTPARHSFTTDSLTLTMATAVVADAAFRAEGEMLKDYLKALLLPGAETKSQASILIQKKKGLEPEAYELHITAQGAVISASTAAGAFYGVQSLKTLLPPLALAQKQLFVKVPGATVSDKPEFAHRAIMLDVARNFQPKAEVLKLLDLMALYKLNVLHLHLNDDEGWRLEIPSLPELTAVGGTRGHTSDNKSNLQPSFGSGPATANTSGTGFFSKSEFIQLLKYAQERHIQVIPEIETPGHARAAIKAMDARYERLMQAGKPAEAKAFLLRDLKDQSKYSSVQHWNDNVIDVALPSTYAFLEKVVADIQQMYREAGVPLETVHMGGDEVPAGVWLKSPAVEALMKINPDVSSPEDLWPYFYTKVNAMLQARGLYLSGWEEVGLIKRSENGRAVYKPNPAMANKNVHLDVWNNLGGNADLAYRLANGGYKVVLTNVTNLYLDLAYQKDYDEPGANWGGYLDVEKPFAFTPLDFQRTQKTDKWGHPTFEKAKDEALKLTEAGKANIVGLQAPLWSERISTTQQLEYMLLPKLLGVAERAWAKTPLWAQAENSESSSRSYKQAWSVFANTLGKRELPRLSYYAGGFHYRIPAPGLLQKGSEVYVNMQFPGFEIRYTTDGSEPTHKSKQYDGPIKAKGTIKAKAFDAAGRIGRTAVLVAQEAR